MERYTLNGGESVYIPEPETWSDALDLLPDYPDDDDGDYDGCAICHASRGCAC